MSPRRRAPAWAMPAQAENGISNMSDDDRRLEWLLAASRRRWALSVFSQVNSGSERPKCPPLAVLLVDRPPQVEVLDDPRRA